MGECEGATFVKVTHYLFLISHTLSFIYMACTILCSELSTADRFSRYYTYNISSTGRNATIRSSQLGEYTFGWACLHYNTICYITSTQYTAGNIPERFRDLAAILNYYSIKYFCTFLPTMTSRLCCRCLMPANLH